MNVCVRSWGTQWGKHMENKAGHWPRSEELVRILTYD